MKPLAQQMYRSAQAGADWLFRANRSDGRFDHGYLPALKARMEGDHFLRQVGAAFALARAARCFGDDRHTAVVRQAVLSLLLETASETVGEPKIIVRHTTMPSLLVNRLAAAGLLVLAINELPAPADELLAKSENCAPLSSASREQTALFGCNDDDVKAGADDPAAINRFPGLALYGLMRSQQYRPAAWKTDANPQSIGLLPGVVAKE